MAGSNNLSNPVYLGTPPPPPDLLFPHLWSTELNKFNKPWYSDTANWPLLTNLISLFPTNPDYCTSLGSKLSTCTTFTNEPSLNKTSFSHLDSSSRLTGKRTNSSAFIGNVNSLGSKCERTGSAKSITTVPSLTTKSDPDLEGISQAKQRKVDEHAFAMGNQTKDFSPSWIERWTGLCNYTNYEYLKSSDFNSNKSLGINRPKSDQAEAGLVDDEDTDQQQDDDDYEPEENELNDSETNSRSGQNTECVVCGDKSSGKHYGQHTCEGCKSFFKRSVRRKLTYTCRGNRQCPIDIHHRNQCQYCRFQKCIKVGMRKEAVQQGRLPPFSVIYHPFFGPSSYLTTHPTYPQHSSCTQIISLLLNAEQVSYRYQNPTVRFNSKTVTNESSPSVSINHKSTTFAIINSTTNKHQQEQKLKSNDPDRDSPSNQLHDYAMSTLISLIEWARNIPLFTDLQLQDQLNLLQNTWSELFLLTIAQTYQQQILTDLFNLETKQLSNNLITKLDSVQNSNPEPVSLSNHGSHIQNTNNNTSNNNNNNTSNSISTKSDNQSYFWITIQDQLERLKLLQMDAAEFACLKAIVLFDSEISGLSDPINVDNIQEKIQSALEEYERFQYIHYQPFRFGRVLLRLPRLCRIPAMWLEKLFFPNNSGTNSIQNLIKENLLHGPPPNTSAWPTYGWNPLLEPPKKFSQSEQVRPSRPSNLDFSSEPYKSWEPLGLPNYASLNPELPYGGSFLRPPRSKDSQFYIPSVSKSFLPSPGRDLYSFVPPYPGEKNLPNGLFNSKEQLYRLDEIFSPPAPPTNLRRRYGRPDHLRNHHEPSIFLSSTHNQHMNLRKPDISNLLPSLPNESKPIVCSPESSSPDLRKLKQPSAIPLSPGQIADHTIPITEATKYQPWNPFGPLQAGTNPDWHMYYALLKHHLSLIQKQTTNDSGISYPSRTNSPKLSTESQNSSD